MLSVVSLSNISCLFSAKQSFWQCIRIYHLHPLNEVLQRVNSPKQLTFSNHPPPLYKLSNNHQSNPKEASQTHRQFLPFRFTVRVAFRVSKNWSNDTPTLSGYHLVPPPSPYDSRDKFMSAMSSRAASRSRPCKCKEGLLARGASAKRTSRAQHFISATTTGVGGSRGGEGGRRGRRRTMAKRRRKRSNELEAEENGGML